MTTIKLSSESRFMAMYKAALKRQLPFAIITAILFAIVLLIVFFASTINRSFENYHSALYGTGPAAFYKEYFQQGIYVGYEQSAVCMVLLAVIVLCSVLFGLSYMHSKKTVDLYHALPVTRPQLLSANLLASITAVLGPFLGIYLLTMIIQLVGLARYGCFGPAYFQFILTDILAITAYIAVLCAFIAFLAVNVGTVFDTFALTMAIGWSPTIIYLISGTIWSTMTYGASFDPGGVPILCLSPFTFMFSRFIDGFVDYSGGARSYNYANAAMLILCGFAAAAVLFTAAVVCYKRRKSEIAEQAQPQGALQTIVKCVAAFLGAAMFFGIFYSTNIVVQLIAMFIGALFIGTIAELILSRGVKSVKKNVKWLVAAAAVCCVLLVLVKLDVIGYTTRVPSADKVESVQINYQGRFYDLADGPYGYNDFHDNNAGNHGSLTSPESIGIITNAHKMITQHQPDDQTTGEEFTYNPLSIVYKLKNGGTMARRYSDQIFAAAYLSLADLEDKDDFIAVNSAVHKMSDLQLKNGVQDDLIEYIEIFPNISDGSELGRNRIYANKPGELLPLTDAIIADMNAETLSEIKNPSQPALGFIRIQYKNDTQLGDYFQKLYYGAPSAAVAITAEYTNTLACLREMGFEKNLASDLDMVKEVSIHPIWYSQYDAQNLVKDVLPWQNTTYRSAYESDYDKDQIASGTSMLLSSQNKEDIIACAAVGMSAVFSGNAKEDWHKEYVMVCFVLENEVSCMKVVKLSDLPASMLSQAQAALEKQYSADFEGNSEASIDYIVPAETMTVAA